MTQEEERTKRFKEFKDNLPDEIKFEKAGINGEDVILKKEVINGAPMYTAPVNIPFFGEVCEQE